MWGEYGMGWNGGIFSIIHMGLWWILLTVGIVALVKWLWTGSPDGARRTPNRALEILDERYARGEIEKSEFEAKKRDLKR